jgi:hypothetical protein
MVIGAAVAVLGTAAVSATPASALASTEYRSIQMQMYDWCVDVRNGSTANSAPLWTATCGGAATQGWTFTPDASGTWGELRNRATNKCMDIRGSSTSYGGKVQQYTCNGTGAQKFRFQNLYLRNQNSDMCLVVNGVGSPTEIFQWGCGTVYDTGWIPNPA